MSEVNEVYLTDIFADGEWIRDISDGQFTGGVYSELWRYKDVDYEVLFEKGEPLDFNLYIDVKRIKQIFDDYYVSILTRHLA